MMFRHRLIVAAALVSLIGCSSSKTSTPSTTGHSSEAAQGTAVAVTETEFAITLASKSMAAGTYTFKVANNGKFAHNLTIDGPGVADKASSTLDAGQSGDVTVTLQKGSYDFYCSIDSHKDKGMDVTVDVT